MASYLISKNLKIVNIQLSQILTSQNKATVISPSILMQYNDQICTDCDNDSKVSIIRYKEWDIEVGM